MEILKDIEGFEDYQITNKGRVWSKKKSMYLKSTNNGNGYYYVILRKNRVRYHLYIHRLVATAFVENTYNKEIVGHKDCDTTNNVSDNLYWCTQAENNRHPITRARRSKSSIGRKRDDLKRDKFGRFMKKE